MLSALITVLLVPLYSCYEVLPGYSEYGVKDRMLFDGDKMKVSFGTVADFYGQPQFMQIPMGDSQKLRVPKAIYHYTERELGADTKWGVPDESRLISTRGLVKNNVREVNGMYLPIPNMDPINLHFITQRNFEKGIDLTAEEDSPTGALQKARRLCAARDDWMCEKALLHYHQLKAKDKRRTRGQLHEQLIDLGDLSSVSNLRDRSDSGMGVVVGVPGYDPVYMGASFGNNNNAEYRVKFSPPH